MNRIIGAPLLILIQLLAWWSHFVSYHYKRRFAIHGRNIHLPASQKKKHKWFVYGVDDTACQKYYVGSTVDPCSRWASTKKACRDRNLTNTGLYKHFHEGCPTHLQTGELSHLTYTLLDYIETSEELLRNAGHTGGVQCRCSECQRLKDTEDKWMCRLGTLDTPSGLAFTLRLHCWFSSSHMEIWVISHFQCCQHSSNTVS